MGFWCIFGFIGFGGVSVQGLQNALKPESCVVDMPGVPALRPNIGSTAPPTFAPCTHIQGAFAALHVHPAVIATICSVGDLIY